MVFKSSSPETILAASVISYFITKLGTNAKLNQVLSVLQVRSRTVPTFPNRSVCQSLKPGCIAGQPCGKISEEADGIPEYPVVNSSGRRPNAWTFTGWFCRPMGNTWRTIIERGNTFNSRRGFPGEYQAPRILYFCRYRLVHRGGK
jgi:hypothetical protein